MVNLIGGDVERSPRWQRSAGLVSVSCTARKQEGAITARWTGIACRSLMSAQEASRGMRSTPPCALTLNTLTLNNHPRPTVRQAAWAEPTAKLSANQRPPGLHHSTTLCNSPLATADTRASARSPILRAPPPLDSHATDRETPLLPSSRAGEWCGLVYEYVQVMYNDFLPLDTSPMPRCKRIMLRFPRRNGPGSGRKTSPPKTRTKPPP